MPPLPAVEEDAECRALEIMPVPTDAALHRYIKDLTQVRMEGDQHIGLEGVVLRVQRARRGGHY